MNSKTKYVDEYTTPLCHTFNLQNKSEKPIKWTYGREISYFT